MSKTSKYILFTLLLLAVWELPLFAAHRSGYDIHLTLSGASIGKVALGLQTTNDVVIIDSLPKINKGSYLFTGKKSLAPGQYTFIQNGRRLFNFLISFDQYTDLHFYTHVENGRTTNVKVQGDAENQAYLEFQRFIQDANRLPHLSQVDINRIDHYTDSVARRYPNTLLSIIAHNISKPPLPQYMALHDRRVLHTSILPIRLQNFFTNIVPPQPELVIPQIDSILNRCTDPLVKEWCGEFLLGYFFSSPIMGMENVAIHIAKKYTEGQIQSSHPELIAELSSYVSFNEHSLVGMAAPELNLPDLDGNKRSLRDVGTAYTILLFYDEDCPICREEIPLIEQLYQQYKSRRVQVYAVYTQDRYQAWREYALTLNSEWVHVWDPDFSSGFHKLYGVTGTPKIYLLDRNKTIVGRGIDASVLQQILSYQLD